MSGETTVEDFEPEAACYYDRLGLDPRTDDPATAAEQAYHEANRLQKEGDLSPKAFTRIRDARDFLRDDDEREAYDAFLERFGREAGTEAFHTWDDQGRPSSPEAWTPPGQSSSAGPDSGRTPETDDDEESEDDDRGRSRDRDTETERTPDQDRRQQRQQARQRQQSGRDRQTTTRDSGARSSERQTRDSRAEQVNGRRQSRQQSQGREESRTERSEPSGASAAVEAATATTFRLGFLLCGLGGAATIVLTVAYTLDLVGATSISFAFLIPLMLTGVVMSVLTSKWTDAVEDTPDPDAVYDSVLLRPGLVKRAALAGLGIALLQSLLQGILPRVALILLGVLSVAGFGLVPIAFSFTQVYDVTLGRLAD